jgi:hypothetical protein
VSDQRIIVPVVLGEGLDRATGKTAIRPGAMRDIRNFTLFAGKAQVRPGLTEVAAFQDGNGDPMTTILAGEASRTEASGVVVGYRSVTGGVHVFRVDADGTSPTLLEHENGGTVWFNVGAGSAPPTIITAESAGKVFLAHSIRSVSERATTVYYDPLTAKYHDLVADLVNAAGASGSAGQWPVVKFRGVRAYRDYLLGWGFGSATDQDRAEIVRGSLPGRPTEWRAEHYWLAGQRNEPVMNIAWVNQVAVVLKENELHRIVGYSRKTFGIFPLDPLFGLAGERNIVVYDRMLYFWTPSGPMATDGVTAAVDTGIRLDLDGFEPADLSRDCDVRTGFAVLRARKRQLEFVFGQGGYVLSFLDPQAPKWSYQEYGVPLNCFFRLFDTEEYTATGVGYPKCVPSTDWQAGSIKDEAASPRVEHVPPTPGVGVLELWVRESGDPWPSTFSVATNIKVSPFQTVAVGGLTPNTVHDIAWRYRIGGQYPAGYTQDDPDTWPSASVCLNSFTTTNNLRHLDSVIWSRTGAAAEWMTLTFSGGDPLDTTDVQKSTDGVNFVTVAGSPAVAGFTTFVYTPLAGEPETYLWFRVKATTGSAWSNVIKAWVGPGMPYGFIPNTTTAAKNQPPRVDWWDLWDLSDPDAPILAFAYAGFRLTWENDNAAYDTELGFETTFGGDYGVVDIQLAPLETITQTARRDEGWVYWRIRHRYTSHTVDDYSDWTPQNALLLPDVPQPTP